MNSWRALVDEGVGAKRRRIERGQGSGVCSLIAKESRREPAGVVNGTRGHRTADSVTQGYLLTIRYDNWVIVDLNAEGSYEGILGGSWIC